MLITISLLILAYTILGKPVGKLVDMVKTVNWTKVSSKVWGSIKEAGQKVGRSACAPLLYFYYVMSNEKTTVGEKAMIYGAIIYIISPIDFLPRRVFRWAGILDDIAITAFVIKRISDRITPEIEASVKNTLDLWFNPTTCATC